MTATLKDVTASKEKLKKELEKLEEQERSLREKEAESAHEEVVALLSSFASYFSAQQRSEISALVSPPSSSKPLRKVKSAKSAVKPKYWLPHTQETWTGRGRTPKAFAAWEGTAAYKEWKAKHPDEKFPAYPE